MIKSTFIALAVIRRSRIVLGTTRSERNPRSESPQADIHLRSHQPIARSMYSVQLIKGKRKSSGSNRSFQTKRRPPTLRHRRKSSKQPPNEAKIDEVGENILVRVFLDSYQLCSPFHQINKTILLFATELALSLTRWKCVGPTLSSCN